MDADVVVVGAGVAGLAAAAELRRRGLEVRVLEARGRIGGRVFTVHDPRSPVPIELGAEFVHEGADVVHALARRLGLGIAELEGEWVVHQGRARRKVADFDARIERGLKAAFARIGGRGDVALSEALVRARVSASLRELTRSFVESFFAGDARDMSARAMARQGASGPGRSLRVHGGYAPLVEALALESGGSIQLNRVVGDVRWRRGKVEVSGHGPTGHAFAVVARAAVIALPLGVLRAPAGSPGAVTFEPSVERAHCEGLEMGSVVKVTLRFRERFWSERAAYFVDTRGPFSTYWTSRPVVAPVIVAWAGGPRASALASLGETRTLELALDGLASTLGVPRRIPHGAIDAWFMHDWQADPFALGAYSHVRVGGSEPSGRGIAGALFFAGEHTAADSARASVHGAIESGLRAARNVSRSLGT